MSQSTQGPVGRGPKLLRRSRGDRYVGGVCGGVAAYLNMDPTLVRVLTVVVTLFTGAPVVLYLVALFFVPEEDVTPAAPYEPPSGRVGDPVWGAGGPPWEQAQQTPAAPAGTPADPPRRESDTL